MSPAGTNRHGSGGSAARSAAADDDEVRQLLRAVHVMRSKITRKLDALGGQGLILNKIYFTRLDDVISVQ
jgi:hypothetical protein